MNLMFFYMPKKLIFFISFFLLVQQGYSQLSNFSLVLTPTSETCSGNGSIQFGISGTQPAATIVYEVFLLPNLKLSGIIGRLRP